MNETIKLNPRQKAIVNLLAQFQTLTREQIAEKLASYSPVSKATLARDLAYLIKIDLVEVFGNGPSTTYSSKQSHPLITYVDLKQYFLLEPDERKNALRHFDKSVCEKLTGLIFQTEAEELQKRYRNFEAMTKKLDPTIKQRELERYIIELSWKSSKIEGNTYSLLETETLIKQGIQSAGKTKQEAIMILNHKNAFKIILDNPTDFRQPNMTKLFELHNELTRDLGIGTGIRKQAVGITGTSYQPPDNEFEIREALEKIIETVNTTDSPLEKALITSAMIPYLQPFADGNKRSARMMANAILVAYDYFPLSYRSIDENEYKQALILFYETNNLYHVKRLFLEQYKFALGTYFL